VNPINAGEARTGEGLAGRWYVLGVLTFVSFFAYMDRMAIAILIEPIKADLDLTDSQLGLISGLAFAAFYATLGLPLARLADRGSRVKLLSLCLFIWSVMTAITGQTRNFTQLFLARMGVGVGEAGCVPPAHSLLADYFPLHRRGLAISIFQSGATLGLSLGVIMVGILGQYFGWRMALLIIGGASVPLALLVAFTIREPLRTHSSDVPPERALDAIGSLLRRRAFLHLAIAYSLSAGCLNGVGQWFPALFMRSFGLSIAEVGAWIGTATGIGGVAGLLTGGLIVGRLVRRNPRWELWLPAITYGTSVPLYFLMLFSSSAGVAIAIKLLANYLASIGGGVALAAIQSLTEQTRRATAVSIVLFASALFGTGFGPFFVGLLSDLLMPFAGIESLRYALLITCALLLWSTLHYLLAVRHANSKVAAQDPALAMA